MAEPTNAHRWAWAAATARGSSHVAKGMPNQDAHAAQMTGSAVVGAVADGHGGSRYVRSNVGAQLAVEIACRCADRWWSRATGGDSAALGASAAKQLVPALVEAWRVAVRQHVAAQPFTAEETQRAGGVDLDVDPLISYGATVLLAVATDSTVVLVQLGDGDITVVTDDDRVLSPMPHDDRLVGGETTSLCLQSAVNDARVAVIDGDAGAELVLLSSDGYGNSFADRQWHIAVGRDMHRQIRAEGLGSVGAALPGWVADSAEAGGDDVTVLALCRTAPPASSRPPATATTARNTAHTRPGGMRVNPLVAVGAIVLTLLAGAAVGWLARGTDGSAAEPADAVGGTSTTTVTPPKDQPVQLATMIGPLGSGIVFAPNPDAPAARRIPAAGPAAAITRLEIGDSTWEVTDGGGLQLRTGRNRTTVRVGINAAALHFEAGFVWMVDDTESMIVAVDPASRKASKSAQIDRMELQGGPAAGGQSGPTVTQQPGR